MSPSLSVVPLVQFSALLSRLLLLLLLLSVIGSLALAWPEQPRLHLDRLVDGWIHQAAVVSFLVRVPGWISMGFS